MEPEELDACAREAWNAYAGAVGGTTFDGKPLPAWDFEEGRETLGDRQKEGWRAAAIAAIAKSDEYDDKPVDGALDD